MPIIFSTHTLMYPTPSTHAFFDSAALATFDEYKLQILLLITLFLSQVTSQL